jgi:hypothetical protein
MSDDTIPVGGFEKFLGKSNDMAYPLKVDNGQKWAAACGMTKTEAFTMAVLQGLCANPQIDDWNDEDYGISAVKRAKAALAALEKPE